MTDQRRTLPAVDRLLRLPGVAALEAAHGRATLVEAARAAVADVREERAAAPATDAAWAALVAAALERLTAPTLRRVVNATGVVLHTNLGRAPLADAALEAIRLAATGYSTLEYDAAKGARGSRHVHCAALIAALTGAEDALVVNNAASALVLALAAAASGGTVVVSRGELIEIGGGFRIPEIMTTSGATLKEVGTTNRTRLADYDKAIGKQRPLALLKVHRSNFRLEGFTAEAGIDELVALGRKRRVPVLYDLGGGLMQDLSEFGLADEPTLPAAVKSGAAAVIASGDKLLGGPQAGILAGTRKFVARSREHPFARAARADKLTLAGLAATLAIYRDEARARRDIPVLRMLTAPAAELEHRARALAAILPPAAHAAVVSTRAAVGGGAFPGVDLDSFGVALAPANVAPSDLAARLRGAATPVIAVVGKGRCVLDVRTLLAGDDALIRSAVEAALHA